MILSDEYLNEFTIDLAYNFAPGSDGVVAKHDKCGQQSPEDMKLLGIVQWAEKHKYQCPAIPVESIVAGLGEQTVHVFLDKDGNTTVETRKGNKVVESVTRKLIQPKEDRKP